MTPCHDFICTPETFADLDKVNKLEADPSRYRRWLEQHNREVGGTENSAHLAGLAVDIKCTDAWSRFKILHALLSVGFQRIGIGRTFIHVDDDLTKPQGVVWDYYSKKA